MAALEQDPLINDLLPVLPYSGPFAIYHQYLQPNSPPEVDGQKWDQGLIGAFKALTQVKTGLSQILGVITGPISKL
ncbi:hypothetical protein CCACVL1_18202 [Corchorus capsularis]|uniref:Uncharacterized protein n=1 Tax=Corchorus capsularis TaxID=210143 RepID=A0A1R3HMH4_COCAP|nr:hypothetical protein CCACVL1_18202 [Corchorus capsularis]